MPYSPHYRVRVSGVFAADTDNPYEIWSWGFQYGSSATVVPNPVPPIDNDVFDTLLGLITDLHESPSAKIATEAKLTEVKVSAIDPDGHVVVNGNGAFRQRVVQFSPEDHQGGGGGIVHPPQVALCASLQTVRAGRHSRGRFYLPAPVIPVTSSGVISQANRDTVAGRLGVFLNAVNAIDDTANAVIVAGSDGISSAVNILRLGLVLDTQRRRRNALAENYVLTAVSG